MGLSTLQIFCWYCYTSIAMLTKTSSVNAAYAHGGVFSVGIVTPSLQIMLAVPTEALFCCHSCIYTWVNCREEVLTLGQHSYAEKTL